MNSPDPFAGYRAVSDDEAVYARAAELTRQSRPGLRTAEERRKMLTPPGMEPTTTEGTTQEPTKQTFSDKLAALDEEAFAKVAQRVALEESRRMQRDFEASAERDADNAQALEDAEIDEAVEWANDPANEYE